MLQRKTRYVGPAPAEKASHTRRVQRASDRSRITIPLLQAAETDKQAQRQLEREERAQERAGAPAFDGDTRLTLYVIDRIIWFAHWMDDVSLNRLPPPRKRSRDEITNLLRAEFPEDLIVLAWARLERRNAPVLTRLS